MSCPVLYFIYREFIFIYSKNAFDGHMKPKVCSLNLLKVFVITY